MTHVKCLATKLYDPSSLNVLEILIYLPGILRLLNDND